MWCLCIAMRSMHKLTGPFSNLREQVCQVDIMEYLSYVTPYWQQLANRPEIGAMMELWKEDEYHLLMAFHATFVILQRKHSRPSEEALFNFVMTFFTTFASAAIMSFLTANPLTTFSDDRALLVFAVVWLICRMNFVATVFSWLPFRVVLSMMEGAYRYHSISRAVLLSISTWKGAAIAPIICGTIAGMAGAMLLDFERAICDTPDRSIPGILRKVDAHIVVSFMVTAFIYIGSDPGHFLRSPFMPSGDVKRICQAVLAFLGLLKAFATGNSRGARKSKDKKHLKSQ